MEKFNVSVILPIKTATTFGFEDYFLKAIQSLKDQKTQIKELIIVHTDETILTDFLNNYDFGDLNVKKLLWENEPNFCEQVNLGINESTSEWVTFFEFDDEYSKIWFDNVKKYSSVYTDVDVFLPLVVDTDEHGKFVGFTNEATFAVNISSEIGLSKFQEW
jgi:glycosyltransferase involved in cell wall biosynthesis